MELQDLPLGSYFTLVDSSIIYRLFSFEMEGCKCIALNGFVRYYPYSQIVEFLD